MSKDLIVPEPMVATLRSFDSNRTGIDIHEVGQVLNAAITDPASLTDPERRGAFAVTLPFGLRPTRAATSPWRTYFGPMGSGEDKDGNTVYFPDIAGVDLGVVSTWMHWARALAHPIFKARYADVAWEIGPLVADGRRDPEIARIAADAYIATLSLTPAPRLYERIRAGARALELSVQINDSSRIETARSVMLNLHREAVESRSQWWHTFDHIMDNKGAGTTDAERAELLQSLEDLLCDFTDSSDPAKFNPHDAESAAKRLIRIYRKAGKADDVKRLHAVVARTFEHFAGLAGPMLASVALQTAVNAYRDAGLREDSARARILMQEKIGAARDEMVPISTEIEIKGEDMETFLASIVVDKLGNTFVNIAAGFLCSRKRLEDLVQAVAKEAPIQATLSHTILAENHVAAKIGSVAEDTNGRLLGHALLSFGLDSVWLQQALFRTIDRHTAVPQHFVGWANRLSLFDDVTFLLDGVTAWYEGDLVKALHVLVPQVEAGLRSIVGKLGKPVTKAHGTLQGVGVATNMGDILNNRDIVEALGPDLSLHFQALYADPRGRNLRNSLAHGLIRPKAVSQDAVNWVIHTLLVFGIWDKIAEERR